VSTTVQHIDDHEVTDPQARSTIEMSCPAEAGQLPVLRAIATSLALRADADLDTVSDLRLAVDEVCSTLIRAATPGEALHCAFRRVPDGVEIEARVHASAPPSDNRFATLMLEALTDRIEQTCSPDLDGFAVRTVLLVRTAVASGKGAE
jgi:serine/threonine-protein kinase RsbW